MRFRVLFGVAVILAGVSCGDEEPTGITAGERMTVDERVAIGPALEKAARALDNTRRPADTVLADWIRIGAGLVSRQGQHGRMSVRVQPRSGSGGAFGGACPGVGDTEDFTCTTGRQAILPDVALELSAQIIDIDWDAVVLPSFRIVRSVLGP